MKSKKNSDNEKDRHFLLQKEHLRLGLAITEQQEVIAFKDYLKLHYLKVTELKTKTAEFIVQILSILIRLIISSVIIIFVDFFAVLNEQPRPC